MAKEKEMSKFERNNEIANATKKILDKVLKSEATSTSCWLVYQPKAPKELERFKRTDVK